MKEKFKLVDMEKWERADCYKHFSTSELNEILEDDWGKGTSIQRILLSKNQLVEMIKNGVNKVLDVK